MEINTDADAFVRNGPSANENFGDVPLLEVKDGSDKYDRRVFIRFNLQGVQKPVSKAVLKLTVKKLPNGDPSPVKIFAAGDDWREDKISFNHQPGIGAQLSTASISDLGEFQVDITSYVNAEIAGDKVLTVMLLDDTTARRLIQFWSREGQHPPILQLAVN